MSDNLQARVGSGADPSLRTEEKSSGLHTMVVDAGEHVRDYVGVQSLSVGATVSTLTVPGTATHAEIYMDAAASGTYVRYWHGTNPTSAVGIRLYGDQMIPSAQPAQFRVTNGDAVGPVLRINYYRYV